MNILSVVLALFSVMNLATWLALLLAPEWFFANVGDYAPFNRHYAGDLGAYVLAIGVGLMVAATAPYRYPALTGIAALGNGLHALNHLYDDVLRSGFDFDHVLKGALPVGVSALVLLAVWIVTRRGDAGAA